MTPVTAENSALHHKNKFYFQINLNRENVFQIVIIFHNSTVFLWKIVSATEQKEMIKYCNLFL